MEVDSSRAGPACWKSLLSKDLPEMEPLREIVGREVSLALSGAGRASEGSEMFQRGVRSC